MYEKEKKENHGGMSEAEEVREMLDLVSEKIPALIKSIVNAVYGSETGVNYGKSVAGFYKELKSAGMSDEVAIELTRKYMESLDFAGMIGKAIGSGAHHHRKSGRDISDEIKQQIEHEIKTKSEKSKD